MKTPRLPLLLVVSALLLAPVLRAAETAASGEKLYVTIETFEPIEFNELRQSHVKKGEIVLNTLKDTAAASAQLAGLSADVVVLDDEAKAPAGAPVLRLTWTDGRRSVTADLTENGKNHYLGVVSRESLLSHPDHMRLQREVDFAFPSHVRRDAVVRTETEANLYFALKLVANRRARLAAKS
jgi:hypothetical protein